MFGRSKQEKEDKKKCDARMRKHQDEWAKERKIKYKKDEALGQLMKKKCNFVDIHDDSNYYRILCELKDQRGPFEFCDGKKCILMRLLEGYR